MQTNKKKFRRSLFWDVDPRRIDVKKRVWYVIERILDFGNEEEVRWMIRQYPLRQIREVVKKSRVLFPKSRALWSLVFR